MNGRNLLLGIGLIIAIQLLIGCLRKSPSPEGSVSASSRSRPGVETSTAVAKHSSAIEVTDFCTAETGATDNTVCVQSAIDQAASMGGGRVHFAPGKYLFKGTLNLNASNITLDCGDMSATLHFDNGAHDDIRVGFQPGVVAHPGIRGCWITHPETKTGGVSLRYNNVFNGITENVQIDNPYDGIEVENFRLPRI